MSLTMSDVSSLKVDSYPCEEQAEVTAILESLSALASRNSTVEYQLMENKKEITELEGHSDRVASLKRELEDINKKLTENHSFFAEAQSYLNCPGESERECMEKELVTLQNQVTEKEGFWHQKRSSHASYVKKLMFINSSKEARLKSASEIIKNLSTHVQQDVLSITSIIQPVNELKSLQEMCQEREEEVANTHKELEATIAKDQEVTTALQALQENIQEVIPRVESEKDEVAQGILTEWESEKQQLISIYGRLCVINREQNYHLMRGTHIKRKSTSTDKQGIGSREKRLNLDNTELACSVNALRDKVNITEADVRSLLVQLTHFKKLNDAERNNFNSAKSAAEERLQEANNVHQEMQIENNELRKLKSELLTVLQNIRENHLTIQRHQLALTESEDVVHQIENIH